jgi:hypothetical protein
MAGSAARAGFQFADALFHAVEAGEGFAAILFDVSVEHFQLSGDMFHGSGEANYGVASFVVAATKAHCPHCCNADRSTSYSGDYFDHGCNNYGYSLPSLAAKGFLATTAWA